MDNLTIYKHGRTANNKHIIKSRVQNASYNYIYKQKITNKYCCAIVLTKSSFYGKIKADKFIHKGENHGLLRQF